MRTFTDCILGTKIKIKLSSLRSQCYKMRFLSNFLTLCKVLGNKHVKWTLEFNMWNRLNAIAKQCYHCPFNSINAAAAATRYWNINHVYAGRWNRMHSSGIMGKNLTRTLKRVHGNRIKGFENILKDSLDELIYHLGKGKNALNSSHPKNYKGGFFVAYYARLIFTALIW